MINFESVGDIEGAKTYRQGQWHGIASNANMPKMVEHWRALGTLYLNGNDFTATTTAAMNDHWTTIGFDPNQLNHKSKISARNAQNAFAIPLMVNTFADALGGFLYAQDLKQELADNPATFAQKYGNEITQTIKEAPTDPATIYTNEDSFANFSVLGQNARTQFASAEYHHAAMTYLQNSGAFNRIAESLELQQDRTILHDVISDYFKAVKAHGSTKLTNHVLTNRLQTTLDTSAFNMSALIDAFYTPPANAPQTNPSLTQ